MTSDEVFLELLDRLNARRGNAILISRCELNAWPANIVAAMKSQGLLSQTRPAKTAVCHGCERECAMPVHFVFNAAGHSQVLIVCDKRDDVSRVSVALDALEQWQVSCDALADILAKLLGLRRSDSTASEVCRWEIGLLKGAKHSSHLVLNAENGLLLSLAGHTIPLAEVLTFDGQSFKVDRKKLTRCVDQPLQGGGDIESAVQRRERLKQRVQELKNKGVKSFLKTVAEEEGISVGRVKQLLKEPEQKATKPKLFQWPSSR